MEFADATVRFNLRQRCVESNLKFFSLQKTVPTRWFTGALEFFDKDQTIKGTNTIS